MNCAFYLDGDPPVTTAQQKGIRILRSKSTGKLVPLHFQKDKTAEAEAWFVSRIAPHAPPKGTKYFPEGIALRLEVVFVFDWRKADRKLRLKGGLAECVWKLTKPDASNMTKLVADILTEAGFWDDDAQVCEEITRKVHGDRPGVFIGVEELKPYGAMPAPWYRCTKQTVLP